MDGRLVFCIVDGQLSGRSALVITLSTSFLAGVVDGAVVCLIYKTMLVLM